MRPAKLTACLAAAFVSVGWSSHAFATGTLRPNISPGIDIKPVAGVTATGNAEFLAVRINGVDQPGSVLAYRLADGSMAVPSEALVEWRLSAPPGPRLNIDGREHVRLNSIESLRWHIDAQEQVLVIEVGARAFRRNGIEVASQDQGLALPAASGGYVNYDFNIQMDQSGQPGTSRTVSRAAFLEGGGSNTFGTGRTSGVWRSTLNTPRLTRLDSVWSIDRPADFTSVQIGDAIGASGQWGRPVRFGGVRWSSDFSIRPGFVSFPLPSIKGEATVPSVVDLYVNNAHQLQGNVPPGAFDLPDVPVVTGQGQIRMVVRDLLGREQVVVQPYYVTPALLRPELHDFSVEAGMVRVNYGIDSFRYGRALGVLTDRSGVSSTFTREYRLEVTREQQTAGAGGVLLVADSALLSGSVAVSRNGAAEVGLDGAEIRHAEQHGALFTAGAEHQSDSWSATLNGRYATRGFAQIGQSFAGAAPQRYSMSAGIASTVGSGGVGVNIIAVGDWADVKYRTLSFNYGRKFGVFGYGSVYASRTAGSSTGTAIGFTFTQVFGSNTSASESVYKSRDRQRNALADSTSDQRNVQLSSSPPADTGFGYRVLAEVGDSRRVNAEGTWQGETSVWNAGIAQQNHAGSFRLGAAGGVAVMPEGFFMARRIEGSFAVVEVGDYPNVRVTRDNQVVAHTDSSGHAFVGGLRGYESNRIGVDSADLPLDAQVESLSISVAPPSRSGVSINFPVVRARAATLRIVDGTGRALPPGSIVRISGQVREFPVGFDGRLFLVGLGDHGRLSATWPDGSCTVNLDWPPSEDEVPDLGNAVCR